MQDCVSWFISEFPLHFQSAIQSSGLVMHIQGFDSWGLFSEGGGKYAIVRKHSFHLLSGYNKVSATLCNQICLFRNHGITLVLKDM